MFVSKEEVDEMSRLQRILNGEKPDTAPLATHSNEVVMENSHKRDVQAMAEILSKLYNSTDKVVGNLAKNSEIDSVLRESLETSVTKRGSKIGEWEIQETTVDKGNREVKEWQVVNSITSSVIARDINLYEVAHGLVKLLNKGEKINSSKVLELLNLDEEYRRTRNDALHFKRHFKLNENKDSHKASIFEARYQHSRELALAAKARIVKLYGL